MVFNIFRIFDPGEGGKREGGRGEGATHYPPFPATYFRTHLYGFLAHDYSWYVINPLPLPVPSLPLKCVRIAFFMLWSDGSYNIGSC